MAVLAALALSVPARSYAAPVIGEAAPVFSAQDSKGKTQSLSDYRGRVIVLEWTNHDCPFVKKHYDSGNMQKLQKAARAEKVVWLSIISSAPGEQGYVSAKRADALSVSRKASPSAVILDPEGKIGRLYGAKTTPHMYVIDTQGKLAYMGAIDSIASADTSDIAAASNYVQLALEAVEAGKQPETVTSTPYGCSVKYSL